MGRMVHERQRGRHVVQEAVRSAAGKQLEAFRAEGPDRRKCHGLYAASGRHTLPRSVLLALLVTSVTTDVTIGNSPFAHAAVPRPDSATHQATAAQQGAAARQL